MKKPVFIIACLLITVPCTADTFTNRKTNEVFQGYATQKKRGSKTLVRIGDKQAPEYLDLVDYDIEWNPSGRRNQIIILPIKNEIKLECETKAFENAIKKSSNQGPLLILIEIDTLGGRKELMGRICDAIITADNCRIVAFVSGGKYGGAYSAGAIIALACDYIYMADGTAIGAATPILISHSEVKDVKSAFGETVGEKFMSAERAYIATLAEQNGRSALIAKAMVDKDIEVLEVIEDGNTIFIAPEDKKESQSLQRILNKKGLLLTLTAAEAVKCGIANKLLNSEEEIISEFGFEKPRMIRNQDVIKARYEFENAERKIKKIYDDIDYLRKDIVSLNSQFNSQTKYYNRELNELNNLINRSSSKYYYAIKRQKKRLEKISSKRDNLKTELLRVLQKLSSKCKGAIFLGESYPDLHVDVDSLNKEINSVEVLYKTIE